MISLQLFSCNEAPKKNINNKEGKEMKQETSYQIITKWLNLRDLKLIDFVSKNVIKVENNEYEKLKNLTRIYFENEASKIYFFDKTEKSVMIYIEDEDKFKSLSLNKIINKFGQAEAVLGSRAGKRANHYIYSKNGFSFSELDDQIIFFEVFPNCTLKYYKEKIYIEPSLFRK